jgi:hypothetical protein
VVYYEVEREMIIRKKSGLKGLIFMGVAAAVLWEMAVSQGVSAAAGGDLVQVISTPAGLTVEAHGADVVQILREVGVQVGFMVVVRGTSYPVLDVSIKDTSLEEVLQQLLRGENYTLVYRSQGEGKAEGNGKLGKVVLLSPSTTLAATPGTESGGQRQELRQALIQNQENTLQPSDAQSVDRVTAAVFSQKGWRDIQEKKTGNPLTDPVTVKDLLETQTLQALVASGYAETLSTDGQSSAESSPEAPSERMQLGEEEQRNVQQALAITVQTAQRNLATLVENLSSATNAFFDAQASQGRSGR